MKDRQQSIADLRPEQREQLRLKLAQLRKGPDARPRSTPGPAPGVTVSAPLSYAQRRIWFFTQLAPESPAYNIVQGRRLAGLLNPHRLEQSINEVIRRHETLRASIMEVNGEPVQVMAPDARLSAPLIDLRNFSADAQESVVQRLAAADAERPFDLARGPLIRVILLRLGIDRSVLLVTAHHIIADFWSLGVLMGELTALQSSYSRGEPSTLAELPVQYRDYVQWQREWMMGGAPETQLDYWRERLRDPLPETVLPHNGRPSSARDLRGGTRAVLLSRGLSESVRALSSQEGGTLTMTLLAAFLVLLRRLMAIANRTRAEFEPLIGFFVNTLALRVDLSGAPGFTELLRRAREQCVGAYAHQDLPFDKLVEDLKPERKLNGQPFFNILFNSLSAPPDEARIDGLDVSNYERLDPESKFAITLNVGSAFAWCINRRFFRPRRSIAC